MGTSVRPVIDHTQLKPEQWQDVLNRALADLKTNPTDQEALDAVRDANEALNAYERPAIEAGEKVGESGFGKVGPALAGLGQAALDIPRGIAQTLMHPIETVKNIPRIPGQIAGELASGDPERISRAVGNVGSLALPFAKVTRAAGAPTVGQVAGRAATAPFRAVGELIQRPAKRGAQIEAQTAEHLARQKLLEQRLEAGKQRMTTEARRAGQAEEIHGAKMERAGLGVEQAKQQMAKVAQEMESKRAKTPLELAKAEQSLKQLEDKVRNMPLSNERTVLANELVRLRIRKLEQELGIEGAVESAVPEATAAPVTLPTEAPPVSAAFPGETVQPMAGTARGIEVTGTRAPRPQAPQPEVKFSLPEAQQLMQRLERQRARHAQIEAKAEPPTGGVVTKALEEQGVHVPKAKIGKAAKAKKEPKITPAKKRSDIVENVTEETLSRARELGIQGGKNPYAKGTRLFEEFEKAKKGAK